MTKTDELLERAAARAAREHQSAQPGDGEEHPASGPAVAIVVCMDARIDVYSVFGLRSGEAHVIRNAGGVVTDDVVRSLTISQHLLGTTEVILVHHADCGMRTFTDEGLRAQLLGAVGFRPPWAPESFSDSSEDVRESIARVKASPFLTSGDRVRGFVYDERSGSLAEIS